MKIKAISPGYVWVKKDSGGHLAGFSYCFHVIDYFARKTTVESTQTFTSAAAAKQAMRERVALERKHNGLI